MCEWAVHAMVGETVHVRGGRRGGGGGGGEGQKLPPVHSQRKTDRCISLNWKKKGYCFQI